jgi:hypothetical protein
MSQILSSSGLARGPIHQRALSLAVFACGDRSPVTMSSGLAEKWGLGTSPRMTFVRGRGLPPMKRREANA